MKPQHVTCDYLGIPPQECHVGMFSLERCALAESVLKSWGGVVPQRIVA